MPVCEQKAGTDCASSSRTNLNMDCARLSRNHVLFSEECTGLRATVCDLPDASNPIAANFFASRSCATAFMAW